MHAGVSGFYFYFFFKENDSSLLEVGIKGCFVAEKGG